MRKAMGGVLLLEYGPRSISVILPDEGLRGVHGIARCNDCSASLWLYCVNENCPHGTVDSNDWPNFKDELENFALKHLCD